MAGRHQSQYTRYTSSNQPYSISNNNSLTVPYPSSQHQQQQQQQQMPSNQSYTTINNTYNTSMSSPYANSPSPGYHSPNLSRSTPQPQLKKYTLQPPRKLPLSKTMPSLGFPGMFPQRAGQDEDILTESNVRHGFMDRPVVSNEHTCAHDIVYGKLQDDQRLLGELGSFMVDVLQRQNRAGLITGPSSFKAPIRTTLSDAKREQWIQDLAGGVVPLRKLARNVPHGFKGEKLLETLASKQVPFLRATWYIKIIGLSEMSQRNASNATTSLGPQPIQWTAIVTGHLKKQLTELLPITNTTATANTTTATNTTTTNASSPHPSTPGRNYRYDTNQSRPWHTPETKQRFEQRWSYSVRLTRWQYFEGLLDQRTFLKWTLDTLASSASFEMMWLVLTGIIQDYVDEYKRNRTLTKLLIETLIKSYSALAQCIHPDESTSLYHGLKQDIEHLLQSLFLSAPDMFVIPKLYYQYRYLFDSILGDTNHLKPLSDVSRVLREYWTMVKARNEVFCGTLEENSLKAEESKATPADPSSITSSPLAPITPMTPTLTVKKSKTISPPPPIPPPSSELGIGSEERIVQLLDDISKNVESVSGLLLDQETWIDVRGHSAKSAVKSIFGSRISSQAFTERVHSMCRWATNQSRYGDDKAYLVGSVLMAWLQQQQGRHYQQSTTVLQDALIRFLDQQIQETENSAVIYLFDVLIRLRLFSYQKYLLRLIARGDLEPKRRNSNQIQHCLHYLAAFPLLSPTPAYLINQRRVALYGTKQESHPSETQTLEHLKHLARMALMGYDRGDTDGLFGTDAQEMTQPLPTDTQRSYELAFEELSPDFQKALESATRYSLLDFTSNWLLDQVKRFVVKSIQIGEDNWRVMTSPGSCLLNTRQFVTLVSIMDHAKDYLSLIDMTLWALEKTSDRTMLPYIIDCLRKYANYWKLTNHGPQVVHAVWSKHAALTSRGNRERCIMMYMVQLVQEGHLLDEVARAQLQHDLQVKYKSRTSPISIRHELSQLIKDASPSSQQMVSEVVCKPAQMHGWIGAILENVGDLLAQESHTVSFQFYRLVRAFAQVLKDVADTTTFTGQADTIVVEWLCRHPTAVQAMHQKGAWVPMFVAVLVAYNVVSLSKIIRDYALLEFERIGQQQQQYDTEDAQSVIFCQNLIIMIRLLVVQLTNKSKYEETMSVLWPLRIEEYFRLQVQRQSQLASSLERIEPMFGLMERLVLIATNLPLSSSLLQDIVMLRADLLQITWFRQTCLRDLNGVYQRFAAREAEAVMEKRIKKKMLNIVDELIGGNNLTNERQQSMLQDSSPDFVDKLHRVFLNVSQWNEAQCRVQVNLLLDNISLSDGHPSNPHILGDDAINMTTSTNTIVPATTGSDIINKDLQSFVYFFYDVVLSDEDHHSKTADVQRRFQFFKNLIHELREPVLLQLLQHSARLLEGDPSQSFPDNVLLMQLTEPGKPFDSAKFAYRSQSFLNITQHMLAENVWTNEKKIEVVKTVFEQIHRFKDGLSIYKVMQDANVCYADAVNALHLVKNNADLAIALLVTEGLPENPTEEMMDDGKKLSLQDIRNSLLVRLRLVVPFASLIWEHPKEDACNILDWIRVLVPLLCNPIVHGNGSQERTFEFTLDFVSLLIDEVPKELKKISLVLLGSMHSELTCIPVMFHSRVKRIMPFLTHNIYLSNTRIASSLLGLPMATDQQQQQQHIDSCLEQSKPWEWLEDYVSDPPHDNDAPINLGLFQARKSKRTDPTYPKWFKFGFGESRSNHISTLDRLKEGRSMLVDDHMIKKRKVEMEEGELP
ncbi:Mediator of RNA polymerase II transcription subunit 12 [Choanephora cucurbitarum]|uniref:Mediator of RNA polymerase II transcription subunit 12 n=1 Tax=Choanephora cucurbitarum TaxID=101091 RepID=A0A1C7N517_9FUNG|nr:Mediator of RNA polymerase II transcription subunit 12 [Choanephora cucurbitarum]